MLTRPAHNIVKISDEVCPSAPVRTGRKSIQKATKRPCHLACQALKFDAHPWQVMPKQVLFCTACFDSMAIQQALDAWVDTRTGGHGSPISETTGAHMAGDSCVGRWRGLRTRPKGRAGNPRRDHLSGLSAEPACLAAHRRAHPLEWLGLRPEHQRGQPLVERSHCPSGARNPRACPQRTRPPKADDAQLPLSRHRPGVVVRVWVFV